MTTMTEHPTLRPLCIDLDGTLIKTDTLIETALLFCKQNPLHLFCIFYWLFFGKAYLKQKLASHTTLDPQTLPYTRELVNWLKQERAKGRSLILATAADFQIAQKIADFLNLFDTVLASDGHTNLCGIQKRDTLTQLFGKQGYDYAGDSKADIFVWEHAKHAICVNTNHRLIRSVCLTRPQHSYTIFTQKKRSFLSFLRAIRIHQWLKNLLIFIPLLASHQLFSIAQTKLALFGFLNFCFLSSSVYLINDLLDLSADRKHPIKSKRPMAAGELTLIDGSLILCLFLITSISMASFLSTAYQLILLTYFLLTLLFSWCIKRLLLLDVCLLALLYILRVVAGGALIEVALSDWLLLFCGALFLSLAFLKRHAELLAIQGKGETSALGRSYHTRHLPMIATFGVVSGYLSVLIFALYLTSETAKQLYPNAKILWVLCLIIVYWISRMWLLASQGDVDEDPVYFTARDKISLACGFISLAIVILALL